MKFTFFWLNGTREVHKGKSPDHALEKAGYSAGAMRALDFFAVGDNKKYLWYRHKWIPITLYVITHALENNK